jgi:hypothetical protein
MAVTLSPFGNGFQFFSDSGVPLSGGLLWTYTAGTNTPILTYTNSAGSIANSNPIVLDAAGRPPAEIWLTVGAAYNFVLLDANPSPVGPTLDNIVGVQDFNNINATGNTVLGTVGNTLNVSGGALIVSSGNTAVGGDLTVAGNTTLGNASTDVLTVNPASIALVNNPTITGTATWTGVQTFSDKFGSTYTPTITNLANIASSTPRQALYIRMGSVVMVAGAVTVSTTAGGNTLTSMRISLPVSSTISSVYDLSGTCGSSGNSDQTGFGIQGQSSVNTATVAWNSNSVVTFDVEFMFMYLII